MRKIYLTIAVLSLCFLFLAQSNEEKQWFIYHNKPVTVSESYVTPVMAGFDTSGFLHSPYSNVWAQYNGLTRGSFSRLINSDTAAGGIDLVSARSDTITISLWLKMNLPRKVSATVLSNWGATGWALFFHNNYGAGLELGMTGIAGGLLLHQYDPTDSLRRFIKIVINNYRLSGARVRFYMSTNGADSLKLDTTNSGWVLNVQGNTTGTLCMASFGQQNNISDTSQQTTATTNYASCEIKDLKIRKEYNGTDSVYGPWKSLGYGQMLYDSSRVNTFFWDRGNWTGAAPQQNYNIGIGLFGECAMEVNGTRLKDPVLWHGSGSPFPCVIPLGSGVAYFADSTYRESYTNASGLMKYGNDTFYVVGGHHNIINFSAGSNGKTYATNIARRNMTTGVWTAFNESTPPLNNVISFIQINDSISYQATIDSIKGVTGTKGISQYNWRTNTYSTTGKSMNDGGQGYRVYRSGTTNFLGGDWTTFGFTTGWGDCAIQRGYGTNWQKLGTGTGTGGGSVWSFLVTPTGDTLIGGIFTAFNDVTCYSVCKWNGTTAIPLGTGIKDSSGNAGIVWDMEYFQGEVYVFGQFSVAGGIGCMNIAAWNGSTWRNVGNVYRTLPMFRGTITEADVNPQGTLIAMVGSFNKIGYNGIIRTSYNNCFYNGQNYFAMPPLDQRAEGVVWFGNNSVLVDGDETGAGGFDIYNGGSNACHRVNITYSSGAGGGAGSYKVNPELYMKGYE